MQDRLKILTESIKRLIRRKAPTHLKKIVNKTHVADLSVVFISLSLENQVQLFDMIEDYERQGRLLSELEVDILIPLVEKINIDELVDIFEKVPSDDIADMITKLPKETSDQILAKMATEGSEEIEDLLRYENDTAGGIMVPDFIAITQDQSAKTAIASLQKEYLDVEMPFYLYVVDEYDRLVGVCSLRQLVVVPPQTPLKEFMSTDVFFVQTDMDQEEVARIVANYDILAVPVVDEEHKLVGIVTVDDIIDIIREEATEDMLKMAGVGEEFVETKSILGSTRIRLPWLFASCIGGVLAFFIIGQFNDILRQFVYLAAFIPVITGMGGNIGIQSSTIIVRGIATGRINTRDFWSVVMKEFAVGFILGLSYGVLIGVVAQVNFNKFMLAVTVGLSLASSMSVAALVGSLVPMLFARINVDPAVATGPFVTTSIDIISVFCYFQLASSLMGIG